SGEWSLLMRYFRKTQDADFSLARGDLRMRGAFAFSPKLIGDILIRSPDFHVQIKMRQEDDHYFAHSDWHFGGKSINALLEASYKDHALNAKISAEESAIATLSLTSDGKGELEIEIENLQTL